MLKRSRIVTAIRRLLPTQSRYLHRLPEVIPRGQVPIALAAAPIVVGTAGTQAEEGPIRVAAVEAPIAVSDLVCEDRQLRFLPLPHESIEDPLRIKIQPAI